MNAHPTSPGQSPPGRRQQKKLQLLNTVQKEAIDLFSKYGYHQVTVEQIAKAAGISRSTLFRHFATKEAIVLYDSLDLPLADEFRRQPSSHTAREALRTTLRQVFSDIQATDGSMHQQRELLIRTVPELRATILNQLADSINTLASLVAERTGRDAGDLEVRTLASALTGVVVGVLLDDTAQDNPLDRFDEALAHLESALHI